MPAPSVLGRRESRLTGRADGSVDRIAVDSPLSRRTRHLLVSGPKTGTIPMIATGTHDPYLVALSILVASFASYTALDLGGRVGTARGLARPGWLGAAAVPMGGGIWSNHFLGMLPLKNTVPMFYHN